MTSVCVWEPRQVCTPVICTGLVTSLMFNWVGSLPALPEALAVKGLHWHDYGKAPRPGRKVGHATLTAASPEELQRRATRLAGLVGGRFPALLEQLFD